MREIKMCPDCGKEGPIVSTTGICITCDTRKRNCRGRGLNYVPYIQLSDKEKQRIDKFREWNSKEYRLKLRGEESTPPASLQDITFVENYYEAKANQAPVVAKVTEKVIRENKPQTKGLINLLKEYNPEIPKNIEELVNTLIEISELKDKLSTFKKDDFFDLNQYFRATEEQLVQFCENSDYDEIANIKFRNFIKWKSKIVEELEDDKKKESN